MNTPFHYILANNYVHIFESLSCQINEKIFNEFLESKENLEKIVSMFSYIFDEYSSYMKDALDNKYCCLPIVHDDSDEENDTLEQNSQKIQSFLERVCEKISNDLSFNKK